MIVFVLVANNKAKHEKFLFLIKKERSEKKIFFTKSQTFFCHSMFKFNLFCSLLQMSWNAFYPLCYKDIPVGGLYKMINLEVCFLCIWGNLNLNCLQQAAPVRKTNDSLPCNYIPYLLSLILFILLFLLFVQRIL